MIAIDKTPGWLRVCERRLGWLAIPNIAIIIVTMQAAGFLFVTMDPEWISRFALIPQAVRAGEVWRLVTFLALPLSLSPIFVIFTLWFLYFIVDLIESRWGAFKTTFYVLIGWVIMVTYSFLFDYPILEVSHFQSSLFLAAAALFPDMEVTLFFAVPVKIKWLAWITVAFLALELFRGGWLDRFFLIAIFANYLIFFGPAHVFQVREAIRRRNFRRKSKW